MSFYAGTLGQLLLTQLFVFYIWIIVLFKTIKASRNEDDDWAKVITTSAGLVVTSTAICGVISTRMIELYYNTHYQTVVNACYVLMIVGGFITMVAASIRNDYRQVKLYMLLTLIWFGVYIYNL